MKIEELEDLVGRTRSRPFATLLLALILVCIVSTGAWLASFLGEKGKQAAAQPNYGEATSSAPELKDELSPGWGTVARDQAPDGATLREENRIVADKETSRPLGESELGDRIAELVAVLELRHERIVEHLEQAGDDEFITETKLEFSRLHAAHIDALASGEFLLAHEILYNIQRLSNQMETREAVTDMVRSSMYHANPVIYRRRKSPLVNREGVIACLYVNGEEESGCSLSLRLQSEEPESRTAYIHILANLE